MHSGCILRIQVLGVKAQKPRRYYLSFQALATGATAATAFPAASSYAAEDENVADIAKKTLLVCRTETASTSSCPEFTNRAFVLRLPTAVPNNSSSSSRADDAGPRVAVALLATPSLDEPAPQIVAGKEVDQLVAAGYLDLSGDVAARLAAGERVMVPVQLQEVAGQNLQLASGLGGQAAQLQSLRSSMAANIYSSSADVQVLLELMLLDAEQQMHASTTLAAITSSNTPTAAAAAAQETLLMQQQQQQLVVASERAAAAAAAAAEPEAVLSVVVSAAVNLPLVPGSDPQQLVAPAAFVALKSAADAAAKRSAQATTAAAPQSQNPVWSELLTVSYPESELFHEQLQIAVIHSGSNRLLLKGVLLLSGMIPGHHYSLAVALSEVCLLYITVHLGLGAHTQLDALQGSGMVSAAAAGQLKLMQVGLGASNPPLQALAMQALQQQQQQQQVGRSEIWAVWRTSPKLLNSGSSSSSSSWPRQQLHAAVDCREGYEKNAVAVLRGINGRSGMLATAAVGALEDDGDDSNDYVIGALPLLSLSGSKQQLWPEDHMVLLPFWLSSSVAAVLEVCVVTYSNSSSSSGSSSKPLVTKGPQQQQQQQHSNCLCIAQLQLPCSAVASQQSGRPFLLRDLSLTTATATATAAAAAVGRLSLEIVVWDVVAYLEQLKQLMAVRQQPKPPAAAAAAAVVAGCCHLTGNQLNALSLAAEANGAPQSTNSSRGLGPGISTVTSANNTVNNVLGTLINDVAAKQQALEKVQRALDVADSRREMAGCRLADLQDKNSRLTADLQHLRQLLHDEKEAAAAALDGSSIAALAARNPSKDELLQQLGIVAAAQVRERARTAELVHRLQQLHAEQIDVLELQKRYAELQEAHYQQSQLLADQETNLSTIQTLKSAVTGRESVITRLEKLLAAAVSRSKELEGWKTGAEAWEAEAARLREELHRLAAACPADDLAQMASRAAAAVAEQQAAAAALLERESAAAAAVTDYEVRLAAREADRLSALMRAEKAEAAATAAHNELLDVTKRYAREVAQLKTKLAEKDAQLLGGFGSLANLYLGELGPSGNSLNPNANLQSLNPQLGLQNPAVGVGSWGLGPAGLGFSVTEGLALGDDMGLSQPQGIASGRFYNTANAANVGSGPRMQGYGAAVVNNSRTGSPKLEPLAGANSGSRGPGQQQQQQQQEGVAPGGYLLRAGTAEGSLSKKPGSPLAPLTQQRVTNSAESIRSGSSNPAAAAAAGGSSRRTGSPATVAAGRAAAESPGGRRTGSPMAAAAAAVVGIPVRGQVVGPVASGRPTGSPLLQQPRSPLLAHGQTGIDEGIYTDDGEGYEDDDEDEDGYYDGPQGTYQQQQVVKPGQVSMRQQQHQQQQQQKQQQQQQFNEAPIPAGSQGPAAKSGLRKWFG